MADRIGQAPFRWRQQLVEARAPAGSRHERGPSPTRRDFPYPSSARARRRSQGKAEVRKCGSAEVRK
jgi:hypothetical protein